MLDLGLVPGTVVVAEMKSPAGDPTAYRVRGAMIALRRSQRAPDERIGTSILLFRIDATEMANLRERALRH